ncbi:zinc-binding dehydrogenase [Kineococcus sp. SYSU DK001]|uniref:zinc-binding dehydrogenase n=1 Tax=Kineococcus sp. SYSU DK001 TaxID=3383122 RepID=UPI003D7E14E6
MRAAVVREHRGPFVVEELLDPRPGPGEVLIDVAACGVCHTDLHARDGAVAFPVPAVFGHEVSGVVAEVGAGVTHVGVGDRVVGAFIMPCGDCAMCGRGQEELCDRFFSHNRLNGTLYDGRTRLFTPAGEPVAMYSMGGLAQRAVIPALGVGRLPAGVPLADCAILGCAFLTAHGALVHVGDLRPGATLAVFGAGGVGLAVIALARALGAGRVVAVDLAPDKLEAARRAGADEVVDASRADPVAEVRRLTDGGTDLALEVIGNPVTFRQATEVVRDGGRCVVVGIAPSGVTAEVEMTRLVRRKIQVMGSFGGRPRHDLPVLGELVAAGRLVPGDLISRRFSLDEVDEAYGSLARGESLGRTLVELTPAG